MTLHEARLASCDLSRLLHVFFFFSLHDHLVWSRAAAPGREQVRQRDALRACEQGRRRECGWSEAGGPRRSPPGATSVRLLRGPG